MVEAIQVSTVMELSIHPDMPMLVIGHQILLRLELVREEGAGNRMLFHCAYRAGIIQTQRLPLGADSMEDVEFEMRTTKIYHY